MKSDQKKTLLFLFSTFVVKVLTCNLPKSERISCGNNINTKQECWALNCCYDEKWTVGRDTPKCYFKRKYGAGSPIKHTNGLCIYPKNGSTADNTSLVWSKKCSDKNALFLVSRANSTYHIASGKCILPRNGNGPDPGIDTTLVLGSRNCGTVMFETDINGNLAYYYYLYPINVCIGEGENSDAPMENDLVKISKGACLNNGRQQQLKYVYQKTAKKGVIERLTCPGNSAIDVTWAYYGQINKGQPAKLISQVPTCRTTNATFKIQKKCNGKSYCFFGIRDSFFRANCHDFPKHLIVRYICEQNSFQDQLNDKFGKNVSFTSFDIRLQRLKNKEKYVKIIVMKLLNKNRPKLVPNHIKPHHLKRGTEDWLPNQPYIVAELSKTYVDTHPWFTVGNYRYVNDEKHVMFVNVKLEPGTYYAVFTRTFLKENLYHSSEWMEVIETKDKNDISLSGSSGIDGKNKDCLKVKNFFKTWKDFIFIGVIGFQFIINIILGFLIFHKFCKRHSVKDEASEISGNEEVTSKKDEHKPQRVSHQYEYPSLGCRRQPCDHNVVNGYEDLRVQTETEYEHVYHSLKTL